MEVGGDRDADSGRVESASDSVKCLIIIELAVQGPGIVTEERGEVKQPFVNIEGRIDHGLILLARHETL